MSVLLGIKPCREGVILPEISKGNAGIDLRVLTQNGEKEVTIPPNKTYIFNTGVKMNIPEGFYIEVVPRSSMGIKKTLRLMNTCGIRMSISSESRFSPVIYSSPKEPYISGTIPNRLLSSFASSPLTGITLS